MSAILISGINELVTNDPGIGEGPMGVVPGAAVVVDESNGTVAWIGSERAAPAADSQIDVGGRAVVPGFVDSHTHIAFAGDRSAEFAARMIGARYDGGGIATTVKATRAASSEHLRSCLHMFANEARSQGTTTIEIKSGYGLEIGTESTSLRLAREITEETTYLGAHVVPPEFSDDRSAYLDLVTGEMLRACAPYAKWIDVFCEPNSPHSFTGEESRQVLLAGQEAGLGLRVHGNQLGYGPGVSLAVELGAAAVDHCTFLTDEDVRALAESETVATLLPGVEFSTRMPYPDARRLLDAGATVALASDCNPGTSFTSSMPFVIALAVREMGMTVEEAVWSATAGGARALRRTDIGSLSPGNRADMALLEAPSYRHLPYRPGVPLARHLSMSTLSDAAIDSHEEGQ